MSKLIFIKRVLTNSLHCYDDIKTLDDESIDILYDLYRKDRLDETKPLSETVVYYVALYYQSRYYLDQKSKCIYYHQIAADNGNTRSMNYLGLEARKKGQYDVMMKYFLMAIKKGYSNAMRNLGNYYGSIGQIDKMLEYYKMAVKHHCVRSMIRLGRYYQNQKNISNALKYYIKAFHKGNKKSSELLMKLYDTPAFQDDIIKYFLTHAEKNPLYYVWLGSYYEKKNDLSNAELYFKIALEKSHAPAFNKLCQLFIKKKQYDKINEYIIIAFGSGISLSEIKSSLQSNEAIPLVYYLDICEKMFLPLQQKIKKLEQQIKDQEQLIANLNTEH